MNEIKKNLIKNIEEYENGKTELSSYPSVIFVELTRNCNLNCKMCFRAKKYGNKYNPKLNMGMRLYKKIAKELFKHAAVIDLRGDGESTILKDFLDYLNIAKKFKGRVRLVTNLNISNKLIIKEIVKSNVMLSISIDSPEKKDYEEIRNGASFDVLVRNLKLLKQYRREFNKCHDVRVHMTIAKSNIDKINKMLFFLSEYNIKYLCIWQRYFHKYNKDDIMNDIKRATKKILKSMNVASRYGIQLRVLDWPIALDCNYNYSRKCLKPWMYSHINYDGTLGICDFNETPSLLSKKSLRNNNFMEIWNSDYYKKLRLSFCKNINQVAKINKFCGQICKSEKFIDFEDYIYPKFKTKVVNNT